jgi:hypothetical protein
MVVQRAEAQQPSIGMDGAEQGPWAAASLNGAQAPDLPWSGAAHEEAPARGRTLRAVLLALAAGWLAVTAYATLVNGGGQAMSAAVQWLALASGPLALLGLAWLLFGGASRRKMRSAAASGSRARQARSAPTPSSSIACWPRSASGWNSSTAKSATKPAS